MKRQVVFLQFHAVLVKDFSDFHHMLEVFDDFQRSKVELLGRLQPAGLGSWMDGFFRAKVCRRCGATFYKNTHGFADLYMQSKDTNAYRSTPWRTMFDVDCLQGLTAIPQQMRKIGRRLSRTVLPLLVAKVHRQASCKNLCHPGKGAVTRKNMKNSINSAALRRCKPAWNSFCGACAPFVHP